MAGNSQKKFSVDDAFDDRYEDTIRVYGSTTERSPLQTKERNIEADDNVTVWVETPGQQKHHCGSDDVSNYFVCSVESVYQNIFFNYFLRIVFLCSFKLSCFLYLLDHIQGQ